MEFVLWACRVMHIVSVVVWLGGLIYFNAVLVPVAEYEQQARSRFVLAVQKRFFGFVWSTLWPLLLTGILLMVLSPKFRWFDYSTLWARLLAIKQVAFLFMTFFSWQASKVFLGMEAAKNDEETLEGWRLGYMKLTKRTIFFGIVSVLCAAGMSVV